MGYRVFARHGWKGGYASHFDSCLLRLWAGGPTRVSSRGGRGGGKPLLTTGSNTPTEGRRILLSVGPIWAGYFAPNPLLFKYVQGISHFQENWGTRQKHAPVHPLFPLWIPYSLLAPYSPLWGGPLLVRTRHNCSTPT